MIDKPSQGVFLSPSSISAVRRLVHGETEDRSPSARDIHHAFEASNCSDEERQEVLFLLGLLSEHSLHRKHITVPPTSRVQKPEDS